LNVRLLIIIGHLGKRNSFRKENKTFAFRFTGEKIETINLGSYNYLGFANNTGPIAENVRNSIKTNGLATASTTQEFGRFIF
jgi:serine palmitoyltransferase